MVLKSRNTKSSSPVVAALLDAHGTLYSKELGIALSSGTPAPLFRWLCACILYSARISADTATQAARALAKEGWRSAARLAHTRWEERVRVLNHAGYARYDESTARELGETTDLLLTRYKGDLRRLREAAGRDPRQERVLLKEFKGMGDVGVSIFFREMQLVWDELYPFADQKALDGARRLRLGHSAQDLARLVGRKEYPRLVAALVRMELAHDEAEVAKSATAHA